jgi:hypothetical protein
MVRRFFLVATLLVACGGGISTAKSDFKKGRLGEAKEKLLALEPEAREWRGTKRAEYALYRGLVHQSLGDRAEAGVWLQEAKHEEDVHPHTLSEDDRVRLKLALESLDAGRP